MSGNQSSPPPGNPPDTQSWVLQSLETLVPGLREQNASGSLTHESFYRLVVPFLALAHFSPGQITWFKNEPVKEPRVQIVADQQLQKGKRKARDEIDERTEAHDLISKRTKRTKLVHEASADNDDSENDGNVDVTKSNGPARVVDSKAFRDLMAIRASLDKKREKREKRIVAYDTWDLEVLEATVTSLRSKQLTDLETFYHALRPILRSPKLVLDRVQDRQPLVGLAIRNCEPLQDLVRMRKVIQKKAAKLTEPSSMEVHQRPVIPLPWYNLIPCMDSASPPTQLAEGQLVPSPPLMPEPEPAIEYCPAELAPERTQQMEDESDCNRMITETVPSTSKESCVHHGDDRVEEPSIVDHDDSDSVCSEESVLVTINICDDDQPKPAYVCDSWVKTEKPQRWVIEEGIIEMPQRCLTKERGQPCSKLHPDTSRPGLCRNWLKNKCNDVHCDLAHDDPTYPRNMHVAHMHPDMIPGREAICTFWQRGMCRDEEDCQYLHYLPNGQTTYICPFLGVYGGCKNLDDRCKDSHDEKAPTQPPLYYSTLCDPEAPTDQPDRRPLSMAQLTSGGGVRVVCRNMLLTGTCWRGEDCWLEHTDGVQQKDPITLTIPERCQDWPKCLLDTDCPKYHPPGRNWWRVDPKDPNLCDWYYKHGSCKFFATGRCQFSLHISKAEEEKKAKEKLRAQVQKPQAKTPTPKVNNGQSGFHSQISGADANNAYVKNILNQFPPEMLLSADPASLANLHYAQAFGSPNSNGPSGFLGPNAGFIPPIQPPVPFFGNRPPPVCHYCNDVGHIQRNCPYRQQHDATRRPMASGPNATPQAYGQHQTPGGYIQHQPPHMMQYAGQFSSPSTPYSQPFSPRMPSSTPMTAPSPYLQHSSVPEFSYATSRPIYGLRYSDSQNVKRANNSQVNGTPTPASQPVPDQSHPQAFAHAPGSRSVAQQSQVQAQPPRKPLVDRLSHENSQQDTKRKCGDNDLASDFKRPRTGESDQENKRSEPRANPQPQIYQPPQLRKRTADEDVNSASSTHKRQKQGEIAWQGLDQQNEPPLGRSDNAPSAWESEQEKRRKRAQRFASDPKGTKRGAP